MATFILMSKENQLVTNLVGTRIRAIRAERKLTQQQLADLADIPRATLASIERDDANPSLAVVYRVAVALDATLDDLVVAQFQRVQTVRNESMRRTESGDGAYRATIITPTNTHHIFQQVFRLRAGTSYEGKPHPPGSEEYLYTIDGEITITVAGEDTLLKKGDSARFGGNVHHRYSNPGHKEAQGMVTILENQDSG